MATEEQTLNGRALEGEVERLTTAVQRYRSALETIASDPRWASIVARNALCAAHADTPNTENDDGA